MRAGFFHRPQSRSAALVLTLLVVTLLAIILVAFLQTMTMSRTTSKSYGDVARAELAAEAGIDMAAAQIVFAIGTNQAFVTGLTNYPNTNYPVTVIGQRDLTNSAQMMPLVSGPYALWTNFGQAGWVQGFAAYAGKRISTDPSLAIDLNTSQHFIQQTNASTLYRASWVAMTNVSGTLTNYSRFAYVVLDEQARLNPILHTGSGDGMTNSTNWYSGARDIALTNAAAQRLTALQAAKVAGAPNAFAATPASLGQVFSSRSDYEAVKHLFTSQTNATFDMIPGWLPDGGKPKYNINDLATNTTYGADATARAVNIASIIGRNLTNFYTRDPALATIGPTNYLNRLAAHIEDYIDADDLFTSVNGEASGMENSVFPTTIVERLRCQQGGADETLPHNHAVVESQFFVNVWNPTQSSVTVNTAELKISNRPRYTFGNALILATPDYDSTISPAVTVRPNEFIVLSFSTSTALNATLAGGTTTSPPVSPAVVNNHFLQYELKINGQTVAKSRGVDASGVALAGGLDHDNTGTSATGSLTLRDNTNSWIFNQLDYCTTSVADPRFTLYAGAFWFSSASAYSDARARWKGISGYSGLSGGRQDFVTFWRARDYLPRNPSAGTAPLSVAVTPDTVASGYSAADATAAPQYIRNGPMVSIAELGHIYDPAHVSDDLSTNSPVIDPGRTYSSIFQNGGARSLRVGQTEFQGAPDFTWDVPGKRAIELLDLFTVNSTNGVPGRINPNTASADVLATVLSGIHLTSDAGMAGGNRSLTNAPALAALMISKRPYSSLSDLYRAIPSISSNVFYTPAISTVSTTNMFGAGNTWNTANIWQASDSLREEAFGKLIQHMAVQSRTYRIYVAGQTLTARMQPGSSVVLEASVYLKFNPTTGRFDPVLQYVHALK